MMDYYTSQEECLRHKYGSKSTNPRYPHFKQRIFTAGDEEQFSVLVEMIFLINLRLKPIENSNRN